MPFASAEKLKQYNKEYYAANKTLLKERRNRNYHSQKDWRALQKALPIGLII